MVSANQATASVEALKKANLVYNQSGKHLFDTYPEWRDTLTASYESAIQESSKGFKASMTALKGAGIMLTGVGVGLAASEIHSLQAQGRYQDASRAAYSFGGGVVGGMLAEGGCLSLGHPGLALTCIAASGAAGAYFGGKIFDVANDHRPTQFLPSAINLPFLVTASLIDQSLPSNRFRNK